MVLLGRKDGKNEGGDASFRFSIRDLKSEKSDDVLYTVLGILDKVETILGLSQKGAAGEEENNFKESKGPEVYDAAVRMFTNDEVCNALQRAPLSAPTTGDIEQGITAEGSQGGRASQDRGTIRFRRTKSKKSKEEKHEEQSEKEKFVGIFGTEVAPSWGLSRYLKPVGSSREKRIVAIGAWFLALVGLIVSLIFVTLDFIEGRKKMARTVHFVNEQSIALPPLWFCTAESSLPMFGTFPNSNYIGQPGLWLDFARGTSSNISVSFPQTRLMPQLKYGMFDASGHACQASEVMDPIRFYQESYNLPGCFHCLALERNPPLMINQTSSTTIKGVLALRLSRHMYSSGCRQSRMGLSGAQHSFFKGQVKSHSKALEQRGILDFGGLNATSRENDGLLWPVYRSLGSRQYDYTVYDVVDMYCNTYMFSGYFFPSTSKDVKFRYDAAENQWKRSGKGPYYVDDYQEFYVESTRLKTERNFRLGQELNEKWNAYAGSALQIMTNFSRIETGKTLSYLHANDIASILLKRSVIHGKESFKARVLKTKLRAVDVRSSVNIYMVDIGLDSFLTQQVMTQASVSWSAFFADFFGLTSLFLDISVYTLIVAPLIVRAKKKYLHRRQDSRKGIAADGE